MPRPSFPRAPGSRSKTLLKIALPILAIATLTACGYARNAFRVDNAFYFEGELKGVNGDDADNVAVDAERRPINLDTFRFPEDDTDPTAYELTVDGPPGERKANRDRLLNFMIQRSNAVCDEHRGAILSDAAVTNTLFSGLTTLLGGTAAIVTGATAARVLGGTAAMSNSLQSNINLEIYREQFVGLIVRAIDKDRADFMTATIAEGMKKDASQYPLDLAITDVATYHQKCSFYSGLVQLAKALERPTLTRAKLDIALEALRVSRDKVIEDIDALLLKLKADAVTQDETDAWQAALAQARTRLQVVEADLLAKQSMRASLTQ